MPCECKYRFDGASGSSFLPRGQQSPSLINTLARRISRRQNTNPTRRRMSSPSSSLPSCLPPKLRRIHDSGIGSPEDRINDGSSTDSIEQHHTPHNVSLADSQAANIDPMDLSYQTPPTESFADRVYLALVEAESQKEKRSRRRPSMFALGNPVIVTDDENNSFVEPNLETRQKEQDLEDGVKRVFHDEYFGLNWQQIANKFKKLNSTPLPCEETQSAIEAYLSSFSYLISFTNDSGDRTFCLVPEANPDLVYRRNRGRSGSASSRYSGGSLSCRSSVSAVSVSESVLDEVDALMNDLDGVHIEGQEHRNASA